ncbi:hypothetical protein E1286_41295 [Nonomuraea terrae]|uniref:Uncharacterized protein n=1 Tax=Nonomuraea terrae TaxID=2530383 RepID=A0A4R4XS57_9ACTN|nr:hypothetical protein [Nonomuraea terrae]TDD34095.1 hypothetical protein E1286_41295 [Nonomuraea terrae]
MTSSTPLPGGVTVSASAPSWIVWALRVTATAHLIGVLAQAALAGLFVTGDVDLLTWHQNNGGVTHAMLYLQLVSAVLLWRPARLSSRPALISLAMVLVETAQVALGNARLVAAHIPLGMLIFGMSAVFTMWAWRGLRTRSAA